MGKRAVRHVSFDTNFWRSFVFARLAVEMADKGSLALFGQKPEPHRLFGEHLTAEYRVHTEERGRTVDADCPDPADLARGGAEFQRWPGGGYWGDWGTGTVPVVSVAAVTCDAADSDVRSGSGDQGARRRR
jgi:hypothetical protein